MYRGSDYVARASLTLVTLQDVQLDIQMSQKHGGQRQTHPDRYFYGQREVQRLYGIMEVGPKDKLAKPKCNESSTVSNYRKFGRRINPIQ